MQIRLIWVSRADGGTSYWRGRWPQLGEDRLPGVTVLDNVVGCSRGSLGLMRYSQYT